MAEVLVVLRIEGDWTDQGFRVMATIGLEGELPHTEEQGILPPNPSLKEALGQWQRDYRDLKFASRIKPLDIQYKGSIHFIDDCKQRAKVLGDRLQQWLHDEAFRPVDQRLRECLSPTDQIRILVRSADRTLWHLPWHLWSFLDRYPNAEVVFSSITLNQLVPPPLSPQVSHSPISHSPISHSPTAQRQSGVKILAILGHDEGIDVERDRHQLATIPNAEITLLVKPQREELSDQLWDQPWDILFFAGHSQTQQPADRTDSTIPSEAQALEQGFIDINPTDSLSLSELSYGLKRAIANGLQIAMFNSCDGLGLLPELEQLNLPHAIVMKEPIPDVVAHRFLTHFLPAFAQGLPLHLAEREGRESLQALEKDFPCASWLPLLYQNAATRPVTWRSLLAARFEPTLTDSVVNRSLGTNKAQISPGKGTNRPLLTSVMAMGGITVCTILMRWLGILEPAELWAYDHFTRRQPTETQDERLLIITIDNADLDYQRERGMDLSGSLSPQAIEALFQKLKPFEPISIGVDIYEAPIPVSSLDSEHTKQPECSTAKVNHQFAALTTHPPQSPLAKGGSSGPPPMPKGQASQRQGGVRGGALTVGLFPRGCTEFTEQTSVDVAPSNTEDANQSVAGLSIPVFGICKVPSPQDGAPEGIDPPRAIAANFIGFSDFVTDKDSILRRQLLALKNANPTSNCTTSNAFNLVLALHYLNTVYGFPYAPDTLTANNEFQFIADTVPNPPPNMGTQPVIWKRLTANAGGYRGLGVQTYQMLLNSRKVRSLQDIATTISLRDLLSDKVTSYDIQRLQGRIVLVGVTHLEGDTWITPHSRGETGAMKWTPGVIMHAQMVSQLLSSVLDQRPLIWWWSEELEMLWIVAWSGLGGLVAWGTQRSLPLVIFASLGSVSVVSISYFIFLQGGWIPVVPGAIAFLATLIAARWLQGIRNSPD